MGIFFCLILGYFLGAISPSAWLAEKKQVCLRQEGTGNLGASNTFWVMGRKAGGFVLVFDVLKAFLSYRLAQRLVPALKIAGLLAGVAAMVGHIYPYYLRFRGGKGLACFAGLVLAFDARLFLFLAVVCFGLMLLVNYSFVVPLVGGTLFPLLALLHSGSVAVFSICALAGGLLITKNASNIRRDLGREDCKIRSNLCNIFLPKQEKT